MPVHDWTRVEAGDFHDFHQAWITAVRNALNGGLLPPGFFAMAEHVTGGPIPDVVTLKAHDTPTAGNTAVQTRPPVARFVQQTEPDLYAKKANRIVVKHRRGQVVAVIEILSPGNKASRSAFRAFVEKAVALIEQGIHLVLIDLFPPTPRDTQGVHAAIWDHLNGSAVEPPADKPLVVVAYEAGIPCTAYVNPVAVGDSLPDAPIYLTPGEYVLAPLEATYQLTWNQYPVPLRDLVAPDR
jgi:hypothetical protein